MHLIILVLALLSSTVLASPYDRVIDTAAKKHGVDPYVLRAIAQVESQKHPWTFNADGEGFRLQSAQQAIQALHALNRSPWMLKIRGNDNSVHREFFTNEHAALAAFTVLNNTKPNWRGLVLRTDNKKEVKEGQARIRKLWMLNTDIGIAQINYRYHGGGLPVQHWFDYSFNLDYAARLLAEHKKHTGNDLDAAGRYHSKTQRHREAYMRKILPAYNREKRNAQNIIATR